MVELGHFARSAMEERVGSDLAEGVREAVKHYSRRLESGRCPLGPPQLMSTEADSDRDAAFEVSIETKLEAALEREALRQHVTTQQILRHAVLTYLADMDSHGQGLRFVDLPPV